jgi:diguanylate cyclase (GGDEF)-like protein
MQLHPPALTGPTLEQRLGGAASSLSQLQVWALTLAGALLVVGGDVLTGADVAFTSLYLLPIGFGGWLGGPRLAKLGALLATLTALFVDLTEHQNRAAILHVWNFACQAGVFFTFAEVLPRLRDALRHEGEGRSLDAQTRVASRRSFFTQAEREAQRARRYGHPISTISLEVEGLPAAGTLTDLALQTVGSVLRTLRTADLVGRLGESSFALILPETTLGAASGVATRLRAQILARTELLGIPLSVSFGVVCYVGTVEDPENLVAAAEARRLLREERARARGELRVITGPRSGRSE